MPGVGYSNCYMSHILAISGSLRQRSFNAGLLRAAQELAPADMHIALYHGLGSLPLYNPDLEAAGVPAPVAELQDLARSADALLIATPEYNYSIPGVLKNAIDWLSRPPATTPLKRKPAGVIGASAGPGGTIRAQLALRQCFVFTETLAMLRPEFLLSTATAKFDDAGRLTDETSRRLLGEYLAALAAWIALVAPAR